MTMTTMTGYNLWFHRDRGSLATGRQLEISYAIVKNDITEGKNTIRTAYRLVDCGNTTHCTVRHECAQWNDRWTYDDNDDDDDDDEQRVENVSLLPPPTPPSRLATLAAVLRMRDAASIVRMCTHLIPVSKLFVAKRNSRARRNFRKHITFPLQCFRRVSVTFIKLYPPHLSVFKLKVPSFSMALLFQQTINETWII